MGPSRKRRFHERAPGTRRPSSRCMTFKRAQWLHKPRLVRTTGWWGYPALDRDLRRPHTERFGDATTAAVLHRGRCTRGGPTGFQRSNLMVGVPRLDHVHATHATATVSVRDRHAKTPGHYSSAHLFGNQLDAGGSHPRSRSLAASDALAARTTKNRRGHHSGGPKAVTTRVPRRR